MAVHFENVNALDWASKIAAAITDRKIVFKSSFEDFMKLI